jgi:hypothetical protein
MSSCALRSIEWIPTSKWLKTTQKKITTEINKITFEIKGNNEFILSWRDGKPSTFSASHSRSGERGVDEVVKRITFAYRLFAHGGNNFHGLEGYQRVFKSIQLQITLVAI